MTHSPTPDRDPSQEPTAPRRRNRRWQRIVLPVGITALTGAGGVAWWGWQFIHQELPGLVAQNLSQTINRPVQVGAVKGVSLSGLVIGESYIPPTAEDTDRASVEEIEVGFNLWQTLLTRKLKLDITLKDATVFLEQQKEGWITTRFTPEQDEGFIEIGTIRAENVTAELLGLGTINGKRAPVVLDQLNGSVDLLEENQLFSYNLAGRSRTGGTVKINGETRLPSQDTNLQVQADNFLVSEVDRLLNLPFDLPKGRGGGTFNVELRPNVKNPPINGTAQFSGVTLAIPGVPRPFTNAKGTLQFRGTQILPENVVGSYGKATGVVNGSIDLDKGFNLSAAVKPISLADLTNTLNVPSPVPLAGTVKANLKVTGGIETPVVSGTAQNVGNVRVDQIEVDRFNTAFRLDTQAEELVVQRLQAMPSAGGEVIGTGRVDLSQTDAAGAANPGLAFNVLVQGVPADAIARAYSGGDPLPVTIGAVNAQAQISGSANNPTTSIQWSAPNATYAGSGIIQIANNVITLRDTTFNVEGGTARIAAIAQNGIWQATVNADGIGISRFVNDLQGSVSGNFRASGSLDSFSPDSIRAEGTAQLAVEGGTATVDTIVRDGNWRAAIAAAGIPLNRFSNDLRGLFSGNFTASGSVNSFNPSTIQAQGTARFSEGISLLDSPLTARVAWNGRTLQLQEAVAQGFRANGTIGLNLDNAPQVTALNLNVQLDDFNLQEVNVPLPGNIAYSGLVDFDGTIMGTPATPIVNGTLALQNFVVNGVAFEPYLAGRVAYDRGVRLDLRGQQDRIAAVLNPQFQPVAFELRRGDAIATGRTQGELLLVDVTNLPLALAQVPGISPQFAPGGRLNGNFAVNLNQQTATGQVAIAQPRLGAYRADEFRGRINFANGIANLTEGQLRLGNTLLQIGATATLFAADPQVKGQVVIAQANIQDVLQALQIFELEDLQRGFATPTLGSAADLQTVPIDAQGVAIQTRLRRLAEIEALQAQRQAAREAAPLPPLSELKGTFAGTIDFTGSLNTGVNAGFNIRGQDFAWGRLNANEVVAVGNFQNGELTLLPLRLQSGDAVIAFSGTLLGENQSGQLRIANYPVEQLTAFVDLPISVTGELNATATISGSFSNPQAVGEYRLNNAELNNTAIQQVQGNFTYANARLDFSNTVAIAKTEPLSIVGSVPLPLFETKPASDQISLDINVKNEGLALLNVLNDQVTWVDGQGAAQVQVRGTLQNLIATGSVQIQNATLQAKALPDPLTNVNGTARFVQDRIRVETFSGDFSKGKIVASGVIPLVKPLRTNDPDVENPLTVALNDIDLNLKSLYQGGVDGTVIISGAALDPVLSGDIRLSNGQVLLSAAEALADGNSQTTPGQSAAIEFNNLNLILDDNVVLVYQPILRFVAQGGLAINGSLDNPAPSGVISLRSGQVNLFTTQFVLDRGYPQTATFTPSSGLDPILDVRLVAVVAEVTNRRQPSVLQPSEILDVPAPATSFGSLRTVRVVARVEGPASQLSDNLELTSSPPRSQSEIVALIGGGYIDTLGRGDTLLGLANIAGSALLTNLQTTIGRALGLSEFRLFPTYASSDDPDSDNGTSTLGLAAEAAIDVTPALSVSVLKIVTNSEPAQFGLRYRINDNLLVRGSTDFSGDTRASIEYELRF